MLELNQSVILGVTEFTEAEIIDFAMNYDPLDFHLSVEAAGKSIFKSLVTSGPHPFHHFYKNHWIPKFGKSVLAGIGIDTWRFLKPVHVNEKITCRVTVKKIIHHLEKSSVTVTWFFEFLNDNGELFQHLDMIVLHKE